MIVVSDTTSLISLMKVGQLELMHEFFGEIQISKDWKIVKYIFSGLFLFYVKRD